MKALSLKIDSNQYKECFVTSSFAFILDASKHLLFIRRIESGYRKAQKRVGNVTNLFFMKILFFSAFIFCSSLSYSQFLEDGSYTFTDGGLYSLDLEVCEGGESICFFTFKHDENVVDNLESGEWFRVNLRTVDDNYAGPDGWYQISSETDTYEFEELKNNKYKLVRGELKYIMTLKK
jgi:hypothetical protein